MVATALAHLSGRQRACHPEATARAVTKRPSFYQSDSLLWPLETIDTVFDEHLLYVWYNQRNICVLLRNIVAPIQ